MKEAEIQPIRVSFAESEQLQLEAEYRDQAKRIKGIQHKSFASSEQSNVRPPRGGRPATTISSHILLIFSSEPPLNPRPSNIIFKKCLVLQDKNCFKNRATLGLK